MTLTIDVTPELAHTLQERARLSGQSVTEFAAVLLAQAADMNPESSSIEQQEIGARLAALGRIGRYDTRARAGLPPLSDEASSRDCIYEGRGLNS